MKQLDKKTIDFILKHESDSIEQLALKASSFPDIEMPFVLQQISGRKIAKSKLPSWYNVEDIIYPKHLSIEQCSSELTALYKANLVKGNNLLDLTGGMGVDFSFMVKQMTKGTYVETQKELVALAQHNFELLGIKNVSIIETDATNFLINTTDNYDTIYIDPARRSDVGKKTVFIEDCTPNLLEIDSYLNTKSFRTIIKLSPMLDITHALQSISNITEVHIVSVNNECKELLFVKEKTDSEPKIYCVNILSNNTNNSFSFTYKEEEQTTSNYTDEVFTYLYEPNSSIMKAGAYKCIASRFNLTKLHPNSHLYTSDTLVADFPGRAFLVKQTVSPNKKDIKQYVSILGKANIAIRNYPFSVAELRKQTKLKDGGETYIFGTTLRNDKKILIICEKAK